MSAALAWARPLTNALYRICEYKWSSSGKGQRTRTLLLRQESQLLPVCATGGSSWGMLGEDTRAAERKCSLGKHLSYSLIKGDIAIRGGLHRQDAEDLGRESRVRHPTCTGKLWGREFGTRNDAHPSSPHHLCSGRREYGTDTGVFRSSIS